MDYITKGLSKLNFSNPKLSLKTILNYSFAYFKIPIFVPSPIEIQIEPSAACNLKCKMCNLDKSNETVKFLSVNNLQKIINETKPIKSINFSGMGEGLLNPQFIKLLETTRKNKIKFSIITSGQLLTKNLSQQILKQKPTAISFSLESAFPKTYEATRLGAKFDLFVKNIADLMAIHKKTKSSTKILFNVVLLKMNTENLNHIYKIFDLAKKLNIHYITFQNANILDVSIPKLKKIFPQISEYAKKNDINIRLPSTEFKPNSCYYPWIYPQITASGEMLPCCVVAWSDKYVNIIKNYSFGNVFKNNFHKIWNGKKANTFRYSHNKNTPTVCLHCTKFNNIL